MKNMSQMAWQIIVLLVCIYVSVLPASAADLPTLLYSSSERQAIQQSRLLEQGLSKNQQLLRHAGMVQRPDGNDAVWLNEKLSQKKDGVYPITRGTSIVLEGQELRVGDQWDKINRTKKGLVPKESLQKTP